MGRVFANFKAEFFAHIALHGHVHGIAGNAQGFGCGDAAHGNNRNLARAAANIHNHVAHRLFNGQIRAHGRGHRLLDQAHIARAGKPCGINDGPFFHLGDSGGDADDHAWPCYLETGDRPFGKGGNHGAGYIEIGDNAVFKRADSLDAGGSAADEFPGPGADGHD